jgi:hypothetical protein
LVKQIKEVPVGGKFGWKLIGNADKRSIRRRKIWLETTVIGNADKRSTGRRKIWLETNW